MPRKLPWKLNANTKPDQPRPKTPEPKYEQTSEGDSSDRGRSKGPIKYKRRARSHSTSPPPGPPPVSPMREGFEEDDIWMLVEDEFEAIAKTFTAHLHHAEYKKLVKKAREAPPKPLPTAASPMSKETRRRIQRDNLRHKQQETLEGIGLGSGPVDENVEDPWRGTSIAGLIASGSQEKRSLKGIERFSSSTRAAQGFSRHGSGDDAQKGAQSVLHPQRRREQGQADRASTVPEVQRDRLQKRTRQGEERLEAASPPAVTRVQNPKRHRGEARDESESSSTVSKPVPAPRAIEASRSAPKAANAEPERTASRTVARGLTEGNPEKEQQASPRRPSISSLLAKRKKVKKEDSKEERMSQVPMFLI